MYPFVRETRIDFQFVLRIYKSKLGKHPRNMFGYGIGNAGRLWLQLEKVGSNLTVFCVRELATTANIFIH